MVLQSDPCKAYNRLGWEAKVSLEEGIQRTASWLEENLDFYDAKRYHV